MKKISKTITSRDVRVRVYVESDDRLDTVKYTVCGEKFNGVDRKLSSGVQALKVLEVSEPTTKLYSMTEETFTENAHISDMYMYGFINRKIGGEVASCKVYELDSDEIGIIEIPKDTEKRMEKSLLEQGLKLIKVLHTYKKDEKFYYMSDEEFIRVAER